MMRKKKKKSGEPKEEREGGSRHVRRGRDSVRVKIMFH